VCACARARVCVRVCVCVCARMWVRASRVRRVRALRARACARARARVCARALAFVRACVCACVRACVRACVCVCGGGGWKPVNRSDAYQAPKIKKCLLRMLSTFLSPPNPYCRPVDPRSFEIHCSVVL